MENHGLYFISKILKSQKRISKIRGNISVSLLHLLKQTLWKQLTYIGGSSVKRGTATGINSNHNIFWKEKVDSMNKSSTPPHIV